jgi:RNA recognition motif-containing protein
MRLLISNVPADCPNELLQDWIDGHGFRTFGARLIRDAISGTSSSFAYVQLMDPARLDEAVRALNGKILLGSKLHVRRVVSKPSLVNEGASLRAAG